MASEIKVDTISEKTSANGVTIDGLNVKDSALVTAGSVPLSTIDIDGGTDIGAAIVDADLFIVDDGAGGTNRKVTASRIKTYAGGAALDDVTVGDAASTLATSAGNITVDAQGDDTDIIFKGTDGGADTTFLTIDGSDAGKLLPNNGMDLNGKELILDADADTSITADTDDQIDVRISGADDFTFTANSFNVLSGSEIDLADNCELRIGDSDDMRLFHQGSHSVIVHDGTGDLQIRATDSGKNFIIYDHDASNEWFRIDANGDIATGGEDSPDVTVGGICLNQGANDGKILTAKSSDVAHGFTSKVEADTYMKIGKADGSLGGMSLEAFKENGIVAIKMSGNADGTPDTAKSTSANTIIEMHSYVRDGTTSGATSTSNGNLFSVFNGDTCRFIFDAEGDFHADSGSTTYDEYDDAQLARAFDLSHGKGVIDSKFDKFVAYNHEKLADLELVGREDDGTPNHFVNVTGMQRLHNGAIWQQYEKHNQLLEAVYDLAKEAVGEEKANAILDKHEVKRLQ
jgi:hypothetical protein